ncbi:hypothetical protein MSAN_00867100 [Mycena sanguinolenta]|uniref:F-box domain-containing protein n=1 Tax=Mycena sanguinolenta TaxID=230812 RepID=A0A8H6YVT2_9AGAR|nr:hypothetical protein MSAN_00867100 [Mycena sanguinolenta]
MSSECILSEPRLPPELEHRIFKIAALARARCIPALMLVAKRVKAWLEPILYRVVFLKDSTLDYIDDLRDLGLPAFTPDALEKRSQNFCSHVRHLFIDDALVGETALESWLLACTGATNLYAWFDCNPEILLSINSLTNVRYLTIHVRSLCGTTVPFPLFLTITHLELFDFTADESMDRICRNIAFIPQLTHLSLNPPLDSRLSHAALCANMHLQCIVFLSSGISLDGSPLIDDDRFVCIDEVLPYELDWLHGALFGEDYWSVANAFLAARRAGTIERSRYRISNGSDDEYIEVVESD